jgi:hypothetical protein
MTENDADFSWHELNALDVPHDFTGELLPSSVR